MSTDTFRGPLHCHCRTLSFFLSAPPPSSVFLLPSFRILRCLFCCFSIRRPSRPSRLPPRATDERRKERREEDEAPRRADAADKKTNLFPELDAAFKVSQFHRCKESSTSCGIKSKRCLASSIKNHGHGTCMRVTNFTYGSTNDVLASFTVARGSSHGSWGCVTESGHSGLIS